MTEKKAGYTAKTTDELVMDRIREETQGPETVTLELSIKPEDLTLNDWIMIEEFKAHKTNPRLILDFITRMTTSSAEVVGSLTLPELDQVIRSLTVAMNEVTAKAVDPTQKPSS